MLVTVSVRCTVDLKLEKGLLIHIMKTKPKSDCILKLNSLTQETATITSAKVSYISFIDCQEEDLLITINKTIGNTSGCVLIGANEDHFHVMHFTQSINSLPIFLLPACQQLRDCPVPESLGVPTLEKCIVGIVQEVRWLLNGPLNATVELVSSAGSLQQSLPGHTCKNTVLLTVSENKPQGVTVGQFCPQGAIQKMQINVSNITVSASSTGGKNLRQITNPLLQVSFTKSIKGK